MADSKFICYSFYVPENDTQLQGFIDAQMNLSLTMRLLMKAFLAGNGGLDPESVDVGVMDLAALIRSMQVTPDLLEPRQSRGSRRGEPKTERRAAAEKKPEPAAARQEAPARPPEQPKQPEPAARPEEPREEPAPAEDPMAMPGEDPMSMMGGGEEPAPAPVPAPAPAAAPAGQEPESDAEGDGEGDDPEDDGMPEVEIESRGAQRDANAGRNAYNQSMRAGMEPVDDIAAMMGEM